MGKLPKLSFFSRFNRLSSNSERCWLFTKSHIHIQKITDLFGVEFSQKQNSVFLSKFQFQNGEDFYLGSVKHLQLLSDHQNLKNQNQQQHFIQWSGLVNEELFIQKLNLNLPRNIIYSSILKAANEIPIIWLKNADDLPNSVLCALLRDSAWIV